MDSHSKPSSEKENGSRHSPQQEHHEQHHEQQQQQQQHSGLEDTMRSDRSSVMDFNKSGIFVERTLALIKPDAVHKANEIETILLNQGFTVLQVRCLMSCLAVLNNSILETSCHLNC